MLRRHIEIKVVMTQDAHRFISETTLAALSRNPVATDIFSPAIRAVPHIDLAQNMDLLLIAPATANCIAKFSHGLADDFSQLFFLLHDHPFLWRQP